MHAFAPACKLIIARLCVYTCTRRLAYIHFLMTHTQENHMHTYKKISMYTYARIDLQVSDEAHHTKESNISAQKMVMGPAYQVCMCIYACIKRRTKENISALAMVIEPLCMERFYAYRDAHMMYILIIILTHIHIRIHAHRYIYKRVHTRISVHRRWDEVPTISRLLKIIGLFCRISCLL